jgi:hypothetical protein
MHRRFFLSFIALVAVLAIALFGCSRTGADVKTLTVDDVAARIAANDGKTFVFDNNNQDRYAKGHLPSAKWLKYDAVTAADLPADKGATLIFYCASEL